MLEIFWGRLGRKKHKMDNCVITSQVYKTEAPLSVYISSPEIPVCVRFGLSMNIIKWRMVCMYSQWEDGLAMMELYWSSINTPHTKSLTTVIEHFTDICL